METATKRLDMLMKSVENYQKKYQENLLRCQEEFHQLMQKNSELQERCAMLQQTNQDTLMDANRANDERVERLEGEVQILENRIGVDREQHKKEIEKLKTEYEERLSENRRVIEELNHKIKKLTEANIQKPFVHPALYDEANKTKAHLVVKKKPPNSSFKWPNLEVEKIAKAPDTPTPPAKKKKIKLFHADPEEVVDVND